MQRILFVSSEAHPLVKTGGLGDVAGSLPAALHHMGKDVRLVMPAYPAALEKAVDLHPVATLTIFGAPAPVRILAGSMPDSGVALWLVDSPAHFERPGNPYVAPDGHDWHDNAARFATFCRAVVELAQDRAGLHWRPEVVHSNDWQSGLVPALLSRESHRPATIFTIHNLAYQGNFNREAFDLLGLPEDLWNMDGVEFYGQFSFIKGGLAYADRLTTVSPTYAREIRTGAFGYGLEGLLEHRAEHLTGILNGVDYHTWNPHSDPLLAAHYDADHLDGKSGNKRALQGQYGLPERPDLPLIGMVCRLVEQKGIDLILGALPWFLDRPLQVVLLGTGTPYFEQAVRELAERFAHSFSPRIGYDEGLAHLVEAGADMFLMPSRFEPCGLNQLYSLRYGTVPIVRRTGGLADTVQDASPEALGNGSATGFSFDAATPEGLAAALDRALNLYGERPAWEALMRSGMARDYSWEASATHYLALYEQAAS